MKQHIVNTKGVNPVYATFKGGYDSCNGNMTYWSYTCLWGYLRISYDETDLRDGWVYIVIHGYKNGYAPIKLKWCDFHLHMAIRKKLPFIKIGFRNIYPKLYKE